jgi:TM2 domain-containing membrane protein YozV
MYCPNCGAELQYAEAEICPKCGVRIKNPPAPVVNNGSTGVGTNEIKSTGIAVIASFFIPGLGQIYCGKILRGIGIIIAAIIAACLVIVLIGFIIYPILWVWNLYDAYTLAKKINTGEITV